MNQIQTDGSLETWDHARYSIIRLNMYLRLQVMAGVFWKQRAELQPLTAFSLMSYDILFVAVHHEMIFLLTVHGS